MRKINAAGAALIKEYKGTRDLAYQDTGGKTQAHRQR
jgi:GH24 family phage-related lysozyme (muramidase)